MKSCKMIFSLCAIGSFLSFSTFAISEERGREDDGSEMGFSRPDDNGPMVPADLDLPKKLKPNVTISGRSAEDSEDTESSSEEMNSSIPSYSGSNVDFAGIDARLASASYIGQDTHGTKYYRTSKGQWVAQTLNGKLWEPTPNGSWTLSQQ